MRIKRGSLLFTGSHESIAYCARAVAEEQFAGKSTKSNPTTMDCASCAPAAGKCFTRAALRQQSA